MNRHVVFFGNMVAFMLIVLLATVSAMSGALTVTIFWSAILCGSIPIVKDTIVEYTVLNKQEGKND